MPAKPKPFPKSIGACADLLFTLREARLELDRQAGAAASEEARLKEHIINTLPKDSDGAMGKTHKVQVKRKTKQRVVDWPVFHAYVAKTKAWDLLQKRLGEKALEDRLADGKKVPGIEAFQYVDVSLTKL